MNLAHLHIVLNHFPTIGTVVGLGLFIVALVTKSDDLKRASLGIFLILALLAIPTYLSGSAAQQAIEGSRRCVRSQDRNTPRRGAASVRVPGDHRRLGLARTMAVSTVLSSGKLELVSHHDSFNCDRGPDDENREHGW